MKHINTFEKFMPYIDRRLSIKPNKEIGYLRQPVEIRVEIEKPHHAERRYSKIGDRSPSALMQDRFYIYQNGDDYPTKGVIGEPNRFVIRNIEIGLNLEVK